MHQVTGGWRILGCEVLVATVAVAKRPLVAMLVAAEAGGHLGPQCFRVLLGDSFMATHAVAVSGRLMGAVLEAQVLARKLCAFAHVRGPVTAQAGVLVVRFRMAAPARGFAR